MPLPLPLHVALALVAMALCASPAAHAQAPLVASQPLVVPPQAASAVAPRPDGRLVCTRHPVYPAAALRAQATGESVVRVRADADDHLVDVHLARPSGFTREHALLDEAAVASMRECRFVRDPGAPARVSSIVTLFRWVLEGDSRAPLRTEAQLDKLRDAASQANADAALELYLFLPFKDFDSDEPARWLRLAADKGLPRAQFELGRLYLVGERVAQDKAQTVAWWARASAGPDPAMKIAFARLLLDPDSGQRDPVRALALLKTAADGGSARALLLLGDFAADGSAGTSDPVVALGWWRRAALEGHLGSACTRIGDAYAAGRGVERDLRRAALHYMLAVEFGELSATRRLAELPADDEIRAKASASVVAWRRDGRKGLPD